MAAADSDAVNPTENDVLAPLVGDDAGERLAAATEEDEDDRASVEESATEVVDGPPAPLDVDSLQSKTKKELQDMLSKRGLPFSKTDSKSTLQSLLKATA